MKSCDRAIVSILVLLAGCDGPPPEQTTTSEVLTSAGTVVSPGTGWGDTGVTGTTRADGSVDWCCTSWIVPLPVAAGDAVGTVTVSVRDNGPNNGFPLSADRNSITAMVGTPSGTGFNALQFATTAANGDVQSVTLTFNPPHIVAQGENLQFRVRAQYPASWPPVPALHASWVGPVTVAAPIQGASGSTPHTMVIPGMASHGLFGTALIVPQGSLSPQMSGLTAAMGIPVVIDHGDRIGGVRFFIKDSSAGPTKVSGAISTVASDGTVSDVAVTAPSSGAGSNQTLSITFQTPDNTTAPGVSYIAWVKTVQGSSTVTVNGYEIDHDN